MQYLLSPACRPILRRLANQRTLCAFDFDGTLAPIVDHPEDAAMREPTHRLLGRLSELFPCVILSGRARADLLKKLEGLCLARVIGGHGSEPEAIARRRQGRIQKWRVAIEKQLGSTKGIWVEDKGFSLAVHYRQYPQKAEARRRILEATQNLDHVRIFGGKQVVNLVEEGAPHKGMALAAERDRLMCDWAIFVGDDQNDEDAFAMEGNIVPVRVGKKKTSHARYYLKTQSEIDKLLELMTKYGEQARVEFNASHKNCDD